MPRTQAWSLLRRIDDAHLARTRTAPDAPACLLDNRTLRAADHARTISASQACESTPFILAVTIRLYMAAACRPPGSDPQKSQDFRPRAMPLSPLSAALLERHTRPSIGNRVHRDYIIPGLVNAPLGPSLASRASLKKSTFSVVLRWQFGTHRLVSSAAPS
jgi:hypothetical protein